MDFLASFEGTMSSSRQVKRFRQSSAYLEYRRKWQTTVYFQIVKKDVLVAMESSFQNGPLLVADGGKNYSLYFSWSDFQII